MCALGGEYEYVIKRLVFGLIEQFAQQLPGPSRAPVVGVRGDAGDLRQRARCDRDIARRKQAPDHLSRESRNG